MSQQPPWQHHQQPPPSQPLAHYAMQPPPAPPPAAAPKEEPKKDDEGKKFDMNFWELGLDKTIDFVLIFVGLYAALAVQEWQDDAKDRREYAALLEKYQGEVTHNKSQHADVITPALEPLEKEFATFEKNVDDATTVLKCVHEYLTIATLSPSDPNAVRRRDAAVKECDPLLKAAQEKKDEDFKPVRVAPLFRTAVHTTALGKPFENADLKVQLEGVYADIKPVEDEVKIIETLYNDGFIRKQGDLTVLSEELKETFADQSAPLTPERIASAQGTLRAAAQTLRQHKRDVQRLRSIFKAKKEQLEQRLKTMGEKFTAAEEKLAEEVKKNPVKK